MSKKDNVRGYDDKKTINWFPRPVVKITSKMKYIKGEFYG